MNQTEAASPRCRPTIRAAQRYGPAPPASRIAAAIAARRAYGPPLTPEPLRALNRVTTRGQDQGALPATARRSVQTSRSNTNKSSLYGFRGLPRCSRDSGVTGSDSSCRVGAGGCRQGRTASVGCWPGRS